MKRPELKLWWYEGKCERGYMEEGTVRQGTEGPREKYQRTDEIAGEGDSQKMFWRERETETLFGERRASVTSFLPIIHCKNGKSLAAFCTWYLEETLHFISQHSFLPPLDWHHSVMHSQDIILRKIKIEGFLLFFCWAAFFSQKEPSIDLKLFPMKSVVKFPLTFH